MDSLNEVFNQLWIEKYRPKTIDDVVLEPNQKEFFQKCMMKKEVPHTLFFGPPGSGKTTLARIVIDNIIESDMDIIYLNGSDSTGVDIARDTIIPFLKSPPMSSRIKLVFIDEFDYCTPNLQASLRNVMETYAENGRFICTCNYIKKIIAPLQSRFTMFEMKEMPKEFVISYAENILNREKVTYDKKIVEYVVSSLIPDVRKIINTLQKYTKDGQLNAVRSEDLVSINNKIMGVYKEVCDSVMARQTSEMILNKTVPTITKLVIGNASTIDLVKIYDTLFADDKVPAWAKIKINQYANNHESSMSKENNFISMIYDTVQTGLYYMKLFGNSVS